MSFRGCSSCNLCGPHQAHTDLRQHSTAEGLRDSRTRSGHLPRLPEEDRGRSQASTRAVRSYWTSLHSPEDTTRVCAVGDPRKLYRTIILPILRSPCQPATLPACCHATRPDGDPVAATAGDTSLGRLQQAIRHARTDSTQGRGNAPCITMTDTMPVFILKNDGFRATGNDTLWLYSRNRCNFVSSISYHTLVEQSHSFCSGTRAGKTF